MLDTILAFAPRERRSASASPVGVLLRDAPRSSSRWLLLCSVCVRPCAASSLLQQDWIGFYLPCSPFENLRCSPPDLRPQEKEDFTTAMDKRRLKLGKTTMSGADRDLCRVRVALRIRPKNADELAQGAGFDTCVELQPECKKLMLKKDNWASESYQFDEIFDGNSSQKRISEVVAKPVVEEEED